MAATKGGAKRPGSDVLAEVQRLLKAGWPCGLTLLTGEDLYHLDAAQRGLLGSLVPEGQGEYGLTVYGDKKIDVATVVAAARSLGMFASRRVVLVRDAEMLDGDPASLAEYSARPPESSFLIVRAPKLDRRRKTAQVLAKAGTVKTFEPPRDREKVVQDVVRIARNKGLEPDRDAALFLAEICGGDYYRVDGELEKIGCWIGNGGKVSHDVVREVAVGSGLLSGWEVANAVMLRDRAGAIESLRNILDTGEEPLRLLGGLAHRARAMLKAKVLMAGGADAFRAMRAAGIWGVDPKVLARGLAKYSVDELLGFASSLFHADRTLKSRAIAPAAVLGSLIDRLTAVRDAGTRTS